MNVVALREEIDRLAGTADVDQVKARAAIARVAGVPEHLVRVTARDVGGGFGQKFFTPRDELVVALAARRLGRAVKWIEDRRENLIASNHARVDRATCTVAVCICELLV